MDINNEMIDKLADLAKLEFSKEEKEKLKGDLSKITEFIEKLNELNTDHVEPLIFMTNEVNVLRADEVHHRGQGPSELRSAGGFQRKVFQSFDRSYCSLMLTAGGLNSMKITSLFVMLTNTSCKMCFY